MFVQHTLISIIILFPERVKKILSNDSLEESLVIEKYKDLINSTPGALRVTDEVDVTILSSKKLKTKAIYQCMAIARQLKTETERNQKLSLGILKTTNRNMTKSIRQNKKLK